MQLFYIWLRLLGSNQRQKQRELIQRVKPWQQSTGPKTHEGKKNSSQNGYRGGQRQKLQELARLLAELDGITASTQPDT